MKGTIEFPPHLNRIRTFHQHANTFSSMPSSILFILASLIWGSTFWAITQQLGTADPSVSVTYRFALSSLILFAWCALRKNGGVKLAWKLQPWFMLQGFLAFAVGYLCTYYSEQYVVSALVAVLFSLVVIWNPIAERIFFAKPLTWRIWGAAAMSITGILCLFSPALTDFWSHRQDTQAGLFMWGLGLALIATIASTLGNLIVVRVRKESNDVLLGMAWAMGWGTVFDGAWSLISGASWSVPMQMNYWLSLMYLAVFGSVIAFACYFTLIHRIGAQKAVYIGVITPIISVLLSIQLENYRPGLIEWLGMVLCLAGVIFALRSPSKTSTAD